MMNRWIFRLLFLVGLIFFIQRGPGRALGSVNSYDFAALSGSARCWLAAEDPYDGQLGIQKLRAAGDTPDRFPNANPSPNIYMPTSLPLFALVSWLDWVESRLVWCILCTAIFGFSMVLILRRAGLPDPWSWLLATLILFYSPTTSGLSTGNPSVISCALVIIAIHLGLESKTMASAAVLGLAHALKPHLSICAVALFALWRLWTPILLSALVPVVLGIVSFLRCSSIEVYGRWMKSLLAGFTASLAPGGINDSSPTNPFSYQFLNMQSVLALFSSNMKLVDWLARGIMVILAAVYLWRRRTLPGDPRLRDAAFFSVLTLTVIYHRYYDAQLLLIAVPFVVRGEAGLPVRAACAACLMLLAFPLQIFLASLPPLGPAPFGLLVARPIPVILVVTCLCLIPWKSKANRMPHVGFA